MLKLKLDCHSTRKALEIFNMNQKNITPSFLPLKPFNNLSIAYDFQENGPVSHHVTNWSDIFTTLT